MTRRNDIPIQTDRVMALLDLIEDNVKHLDGITEKALQTNDKEVNRRKAEINRQLLYAAHLAKILEIEILNQYHVFRGEQPPDIIPHPTRR